MRTANKVALSVAGLAVLGIGGSAAWSKMKRMPQMMQKCMSMCSEMLSAIRQTTAMAVFATPELEHTFNEWLKDIEAKAEASVLGGAKDAVALALALKIDEGSARYVLDRLAANGKVTLVAHPPVKE